MKNFNMIRMQCYLEHITFGTASIVIGLGILYGIVYEMMTAYLVSAKYAYLGGLIACGIVIAVGILYIVRAVYLNRTIFKNLAMEERKQFFQEINDSTALSFGKRLIITRHFVMAFARTWRGYIHIVRLDDMVACFGRAVYDHSGEVERYHLLIFDRTFKKIECVLKGDKAKIMDKGYQALLSLSPWVFSDNYEEFMDSYTRKSKERAYLKEIELRRQASEISDDTLPMAVITAADIIREFNDKQKKNGGNPLTLKDNKKSIFHKKEED